jgi:hypothetical protein
MMENSYFTWDKFVASFGREMDGKTAEIPVKRSHCLTWSAVIALNPKNADAYYSRALVRNELPTWKSALRDYDSAED